MLYAEEMADIRIAVIGAGSWGTTVASVAAANTPTVLWARRESVVKAINADHVNPDYINSVPLSALLRATSSLEEAVSSADVLVMAVPSHGFRQVLEEAKPFLRQWVIVVSMAKGLEAGSMLR